MIIQNVFINFPWKILIAKAKKTFNNEMRHNWKLSWTDCSAFILFCWLGKWTSSMLFYFALLVCNGSDWHFFGRFFWVALVQYRLVQNLYRWTNSLGLFSKTCDFFPGGLCDFLTVACFQYKNRIFLQRR